MWPKDGYWRFSENSDVFIKCYIEINCKEGNESNLIQNCANGSEGNLCNSCQKGYGKQLNNLCEQCPDRAWSILLIVFVALAFIVITVFAIRSAI